jgi:glycerol uptake facilitator protein
VATVAEQRRALGWRPGLAGELWAEFFGTFILICFGDGVVAMLWALIGSGRSLPNASTAPLLGSGDWLLVTWGWALAVAFAVYVVGGISGAHINPAVTLSFAIKKEFPWKKVVPYWIVQVAGAFVGAALVFLVYNNALNHFNQMHHLAKSASLATYATFATFPAGYFSTVWGPLIDQIVGTFFLLLFIFAVIDGFNLGVKANMHPFIIGMVVMAVGISFGANAGYAINPARDFGPRLFAWVAGWGKLAMPGNYSDVGLHVNNYFWVPIVGPLIGGALAAPVYNFGIRDILFARRRAAEMAETGPAGEEPPVVGGPPAVETPPEVEEE